MKEKCGNCRYYQITDDIDRCELWNIEVDSDDKACEDYDV